MALFDDQQKLMAADDGQATEEPVQEKEGEMKYLGLIIFRLHAASGLSCLVFWNP